jgi:cellulose synthase/poly-beta-1,6-N-acetylglucosamine synthase-like glycosyltransferase
MFGIGFVVRVTEVTFWLCGGLVAYTYIGYPLLMWALSRLFGARRTPVSTPRDWPSMSVVIAAHNEESVIGDRIANLLALDYPADKLEIVIASDGSTDRTCAIVRTFKASNVRLLAFRSNRGKAAVLNHAVRAARGEIILLSDANTRMEVDAAKRLARWFSDPRVGVVCGRLVLVDHASGQNADGAYWKYETFLKECEARLGSLLGANGAIYAIRKANYPRLPPRTVVDDFVIPLLARLASDGRIEFDRDAVAFEETPAHIRSEFHRRSRIGAGGFQSLSLLWPLLNPARGWIALSFASHKVCRWLCPFFLVGVLVTSAALDGDPLYRIALAIQLALYAAASAGYLWPTASSSLRIAKLLVMFVAMNLALLVGFFAWAAGRQTGTWTRTARAGS